MLCAVDDRVLVSFPTVMVSTAMQGGCVCENAPLLRIGTGNIELAAIHAPKPLGMTGADDWTKEIETKGLPELRTLYGMLNAKDSVAAWCMPQYKHNYNQASRELFYAWANKFLGERNGPTKEPPMTPSTVAEQSCVRRRASAAVGLSHASSTQGQDADGERGMARRRAAEQFRIARSLDRRRASRAESDVGR